MIVSEVGLDPKITALVYVAARAPDAGEDYTALPQRADASLIACQNLGAVKVAAIGNGIEMVSPKNFLRLQGDVGKL